MKSAAFHDERRCINVMGVFEADSTESHKGQLKSIHLVCTIDTIKLK